MIAFTCASCQKKLSARDEQGGKRVKCPGCGQPVTVPLASTPSLAGQSRGGSVDLEDAQTLPPVAPGRASRHDQESRSDAGGHTAAGAASSPGTGTSRELYDFLAPAQMPDEIGRLGPYRILKVLGAGGMGVVFQAEDPTLKRKVALKAMLPALAASDSARQRFLREAQTAAAIEHDHIVPIYQVSQDRGVPFIAMPFLKGEPLDVRLKRERALGIAEAVRIGRETARGLAAAHAAGLVRRDIKPANLWLEGEEGRVKILDFGLARAAADDGHLTQQGAILGTPAFMAPEQAAGQPVDGRCDLFSLGCALYCLVTGQYPFRGSDTVSTLVAVATHEPPPPVSLRPDLPGELSDLIMQLLEKQPQNRPQSALAVVEALQKIEARLGAPRAESGARTEVSEPTAAKRPQEKPRKEPARKRARQQDRSASRVPWLVGGGVLGAGVLALLLVLVLRPGGSRTSEGPPAGEQVAAKKVSEAPVNAAPATPSGAPLAKAPDRAPGKKPDALPQTFRNRLGMELVRIPRGKFWKGGGGGKAGSKEVEIADDFYLGKYEVTQEEWQAVMKKNPSRFSRGGGGKEVVKDIPDADLARFPVERVTWHECQEFVLRLNKMLKDDAGVYQLPSSAMLEYACRGGPSLKKEEYGFDYYFDTPTNTQVPEKANMQRIVNRTCKVGSYPPNRLGLHDMHGNVNEWCSDPFDSRRRAAFRGGAWETRADVSKAKDRGWAAPSDRHAHLGLRVAFTPIGAVGK